LAGWAQPDHPARVARQLVVASGIRARDPVCRVRAVRHEGHARTDVPLVRPDDVAPPYRGAEPRTAERVLL